MDARTLAEIVPTVGLTNARLMIDGYNWACKVTGANTVNRCAMLLAQVAHESDGLRATEEYASGEDYNGRTDLGNIYPGDGPRFKGRTLIQITGRNNYGYISRWTHGQGMVPTPTYFVDHPERLAYMQYAWVGPAQYWLADHNHGYGSINKAADAGDIYTGTLMVNGGTNGLSDRTWYWNRALAHGRDILPSPVALTEKRHRDMKLLKVSQADAKKKRVRWPGYFKYDGYTLTHIKDANELRALTVLGYKVQTISVWTYRELGGK